MNAETRVVFGLEGQTLRRFLDPTRRFLQNFSLLTKTQST